MEIPRTTGEAIHAASATLNDLLRMRDDGTLLASDLAAALAFARRFAHLLPDDEGPRILAALAAWLDQHQAERGDDQAEALEAAQSAIGAAAAGRSR